jgi:diguanylate cyclase (GGDEF)-like protein
MSPAFRRTPTTRPPRRAGLWRGLLMAWLCLWFLGPSGTAHAEPPANLRLVDEARSIAMWPYLQLFFDPTQEWRPPDLLGQPQLFSPPPHTQPTLGVRTEEAVWLRTRFSVSPVSDGNWILDIDYPALNRIDVVLATEGRIVQEEQLGNLQPFSERPLQSRTHAMSLDVKPGKSYELLLRVQTTGAMVLPITLNKPAAMLQRSINEQMLQGVLMGLAVCLLIYSLAQWVSLRDALFLQYSLLISGSLLFSLQFFGIGAQYLWTDSTWFELHASGLTALMATCGSFLFISQVLEGNKPNSRLLRLMRGGAVLTVVLAIAYALDLLNTRALTGIVSILGLMPALMGIPGALSRARRGDDIGSTLLLAWLVYFTSTAVVIGLIRGWMPVNFWTMHSFQIGATIDMLLFMHVLGLRTKALRIAALDTRRERDALRSLANSDPLTGLPNRRGLHTALANALTQCTAEKLVAVYLLDLDGFKPVNDKHGHDVGDELLIAVGRRLRGHVRESDVVARLGGDEFVVMAHHIAQPENAHDLGMKLLNAFKTPFALGGHLQVRVGLTIGYAIAPHDSTDAVGLLRLADAAMYSGKQSGKFCLRRNTGDLALSSA